MFKNQTKKEGYMVENQGKYKRSHLVDVQLPNKFCVCYYIYTKHDNTAELGNMRVSHTNGYNQSLDPYPSTHPDRVSFKGTVFTDGSLIYIPEYFKTESLLMLPREIISLYEEHKDEWKKYDSFMNCFDFYLKERVGWLGKDNDKKTYKNKSASWLKNKQGILG